LNFLSDFLPECEKNAEDFKALSKKQSVEKTELLTNGAVSGKISVYNRVIVQRCRKTENRRRSQFKPRKKLRGRPLKKQAGSGVLR